MNNERLARTLAAIDAANSVDPVSVPVNGAMMARALLYGRRMSEALAAFFTGCA